MLCSIALPGMPFTASTTISGLGATWTDVLSAGVVITRNVTSLAMETPDHWHGRLVYCPGNRLGNTPAAGFTSLATVSLDSASRTITTYAPKEFFDVGEYAVQMRPREYRELLRLLVNLQQKLIYAFEGEVEVVLPPSTFPDELRHQVEHVIRPGLSISQVLCDWPDDVVILPLHLWARPRKGVIQLEGREWLFEIHGSLEVSFGGLPPGLDADTIEHLKMGETDVLDGMQGCGPQVEVKYLKGGRTDGVSAWSVFSFARSKPLADLEGAGISESDHQCLLKRLVEEEFLVPWPYSDADRYFVLAEGQGAT